MSAIRVGFVTLTMNSGYAIITTGTQNTHLLLAGRSSSRNGYHLLRGSGGSRRRSGSSRSGSLGSGSGLANGRSFLRRGRRIYDSSLRRNNCI